MNPLHVKILGETSPSWFTSPYFALVLIEAVFRLGHNAELKQCMSKNFTVKFPPVFTVSVTMNIGENAKKENK